MKNPVPPLEDPNSRHIKRLRPPPSNFLSLERARRLVDCSSLVTRHSSLFPPTHPSMASSLHTISPKTLCPLFKPLKPISFFTPFKPLQYPFRRRPFYAGATASPTKELDLVPVQSRDPTDQPDGTMPTSFEREIDEGEIMGSSNLVGGFDGRLSLEGVGVNTPSSSGGSGGQGNDGKEEDLDKLIDRAINATIVLAAGAFTITKLLTVDHDYWHGWTIYEILRYAPQHNWIAYEETLKTNPVFAKMVISGVVYSLGDWIAQALFPFQDWWVVPVKVAFDQTVWSAVWNSIYFTVLGFLRLESPISIYNELKATFWPMLTAGWKLWPFAHLVTYGLIPVEQRLLWVDCVELIWVTILST
ncbi:hypothetical protein Cgig2_026237 [Carnegiea gigantea]|uniref:Peroxisomal membrane protein 2 n=1 Tax=Carnegiea gigantea TaxID=171969 RepID=A0A9Q1KH60_9CARY|nr:hypothetical protein Cgig2_026237 [Carnegiea gigantea]